MTIHKWFGITLRLALWSPDWQFPILQDATAFDWLLHIWQNATP
jgi:hypothetical protein